MPIYYCNIRIIDCWLLQMDRLNVRNILRRKECKLEGNNYNCVLCTANREETTFHLFFFCDFSTRVGNIWALYGISDFLSII
jgi:hypothetical protein